MSQFYSSADICINKDASNLQPTCNVVELPLGELFDVSETVEWIKLHSFKMVALQFPDYLLKHSVCVSNLLENALNQTLYILADTSYESCCVDFVAAAHVCADAIVHYGPRCLSQPNDSDNRPPVFYVYDKFSMEMDVLSGAIVELQRLHGGECIVLLDTGFIHYLEADHQKTSSCLTDASFDKYRFSSLLNCNAMSFETCEVAIIVTDNFMKVLNMQFKMNVKHIYQFDGKSIIPFTKGELILKRRNFLIEKIKDANTIGIVLGTISVRNLPDILRRLKALITSWKKRYYLISVGKPTVAKLANFPELDVYCIVSCCLNELYLDRGNYHKAIATPMDVEWALNKHGERFSLDFNDIIADCGDAEKSVSCESAFTDQNSDADVSLISGHIRSGRNQHEIAEHSSDVSLKHDTRLATRDVNPAFVRTWNGLDAKLGMDEAAHLQIGRSGLAQEYDNEIKK